MARSNSLAKASAAEVAEGSELPPCIVPGLSPEEQCKWEDVVMEGRRLRDAKRDRHSADLVARDGTKGEWRPGWKRKVGTKATGIPSANSVRYLILRRGGLPSKAATASSGCVWEEVLVSMSACRDFELAMKAMRAASRELMVEMAHSTFEECLSDAREVSAVQAKVAERVLASQDTEHFADPKYRQTVNLTSCGGGGITINLVDVSKPYSPPAIASLGDPSEGVEV